jgi:HD-GYP domain-containing protein (c-di-GMP phosphodiesterase class II)
MIRYKEGGDVTIKLVSKLLMKVFNEEDIVSRIGEDEFAVLAPYKSLEHMQDYKDKIIELVKEIKIGNIEISLAIGYEVVTDSNKDIDDLLSTAENHLYRHKITVGTSIRNHAIKAILNTLTDKYVEEKIHSERVSAFCKKIGIELGISKEEVDLLELAGMYHDIEKISIPDAILNKPGKLTDEEYEIIKTHTQVGYQILKAAYEYSGLAEYALSHHERWDGTGYPKGLKGTEIPLFSRIICVSDSFEAMTADRRYRKGMCIDDVILELKRCSGSQFDTQVISIFIEKALSQKQ